MKDSRQVSTEQKEHFPGLPFPAETTIAGPIGPNNPPWDGWVALGVFVASVALILISGALFLTPYLASSVASGLDRSELNEFVVTDPTAVFLQIIAVIPAHILTFLLCWFVVTKNRRYSFKEIVGWHMNGFRLWHAIALTLAFYALSISAVLVLGKVEHSFDQMLGSSKWIVIPIVILAVFTAPIVEETVYRGIMYSAWQRTLGKWSAVAIVTILFTVVHGAQYSQGVKPDLATLSVLFLLSLALTVIRAKTSNLLPAIVLHTVFNGFQSILILVATLLPEIFGSPGSPADHAATLFGFR